jgi:hypothetical protein
VLLLKEFDGKVIVAIVNIRYHCHSLHMLRLLLIMAAVLQSVMIIWREGAGIVALYYTCLPP